MKRSVLIMLMSVLILLPACRSQTPELPDSVHGDVTVSGGSFDFEAAVDGSPGSATVEITSPATVSGVCYTLSRGELRTSCAGLESVTGSSDLPPSAAPVILCETLSRLDTATYDSTEDGRDLFRVRLDAGDVLIAAEDGRICRVTAQFSPVVIRFHRES